MAAVLEAFLFRIQYKKALKKEDGISNASFSLNNFNNASIFLESGHLAVTVHISSAELLSLPHSLPSRLLSKLKYSLPRLEPGSDILLTFRGDKRQGVVMS